ncbi:hypothetical protein [Oscillatoria acuminata]|uniref:hypothetical protein n=1 Tax=Oscillatoria acuminata TaxID=118323 RepID=UPI0002D53D4C|nr:hypothetical protein [Oscillatoria acuminata]
MGLQGKTLTDGMPSFRWMEWKSLSRSRKASLFKEVVHGGISEAISEVSSTGNLVDDSGKD